MNLKHESSEADYQYWVSDESNETFKADKEVLDLLNQGWKISSACPINATFTQNVSNTIIPFTITDGIEVLMFKE
jgi:hypothetical protein